jgi:hypothetical protein
MNPGWAENAIVCRGEDPMGNWTHNERPCGNDLSQANKPKSIGGN